MPDKKSDDEILAVLLGALFSGFLLFSQDSGIRKISMEDYLNYETTANPRLSPDGKQILFSRTWIDKINDTRPTDLWIMNADGSQGRFFLEGSNGSWSPDGKRVAFTFYQALKVLKVPTTMIRFNEEFHGVSSKPSNYMRSLAYMMSWFEEWGNKKERP